MQSGYRSVITGFVKRVRGPGSWTREATATSWRASAGGTSRRLPPRSASTAASRPAPDTQRGTAAATGFRFGAHRRVSVTHGDGTPQYWDFDVALRPCNWKHTEGHEEVEGVGGRLGIIRPPNGFGSLTRAPEWSCRDRLVRCDALASSCVPLTALERRDAATTPGIGSSGARPTARVPTPATAPAMPERTSMPRFSVRNASRSTSTGAGY